MKPIAVFVLALVLAMPVHAEPQIIGGWKSDAAMTMQFNRARAKLEEKTALFLSQILGHLTITFSQENVAFDMPDIQTQTVEGRKSNLKGFHEIHPYRLLGATENTVAIKSIEPVTGNETITVYNFEGPDVMWLYVGGADSASSSSHLREYFVRVKASKSLRPAR